MLCQSVMSFHSPLCWSLVRRFVANENFESDMPLGVNLVSASLPRCPISITLLMLFAILSCTVSHHAGGYAVPSSAHFCRMPRGTPAEAEAGHAAIRVR